ncbi:MAG TPA: hypothetical protein DEO70_05240 [Bacteroidales bacterium]|nr:MAG: hypothetical protein A2X11_13920 [Bacteroidetes bacterium GWE2_42_24]PKP23578.1 MAG: hypothetical protein CVU06_07560 [Bacteroidetes bacterium HGW-Bacteroidetes-22]HBZ66223.1 hypothetical protein [Bacteroidales bacterium]
MAQPDAKDDRMMDEIRAQKVAYLTTKLELTPAEAQQFWPVYNEYSQKKEDIHRERFSKKGKPKPVDPDQMTNEEAGQMIDNMVADQEKMAAIEKEYSQKFRKILPVKKVLKLYEAEMDFKRVLLDRIKDRRPERRKP